MKFSVRDVDKGWIELVKLRGQRGFAKSGVVGKKAGLRKNGSLTNAELALVHEFGAPGQNIPERSFLRATFDARREFYIGMLNKLCKAVYERKMTLQRALGLLGLQFVKDVQAYIRTSIPPPDAPATIARKGSSTTLIDTGQLIGSISSIVEIQKGPSGPKET